jgi:alkylation response protein AidB-like acyl-CoA dehydrogenase
VDFEFSEDQRLFQESLRELLAKECPPKLVRSLWESETGRAPELWAKLAGTGLLSALAPEDLGGPGLCEVDLVLLLEEIGRAAVPEPVAETAAVAVPLLRELGSEALSHKWLPRIAAGQAALAVGLEADPGVAHAASADLLLLQRGDELHAAPPGAFQCVRQPCLDPGRRLFRVDFEPGPSTRLASGEAGRRLLAAAFDRAALANSAQQLGVAQQLVDLAARYACHRRQFGVPIGSFQAVKHPLASAQVRIEFARPVVYRAAWSVARGARHRSLDVSHAKLAAGEAGTFAARVALQCFGALGYTWEQELQIWLKRAWALDAAQGTGAFHRARVAEVILDGGAALGPGGLDVDLE